MRFKLLTAAIALLITQSALATPDKEIPCPSVDALSVSAAVQYDSLWYGVEWKNNFGTKNVWALQAGPVKNASNESEAIAGANYALPKMVYSGKEIMSDYTLCYYTYDTFGGAVAITPARSSNKIFKFVRKQQIH